MHTGKQEEKMHYRLICIHEYGKDFYKTHSLRFIGLYDHNNKSSYGYPLECSVFQSETRVGVTYTGLINPMRDLTQIPVRITKEDIVKWKTCIEKECAKRNWDMETLIGKEMFNKLKYFSYAQDERRLRATSK